MWGERRWMEKLEGMVNKGEFGELLMILGKNLGWSNLLYYYNDQVRHYHHTLFRDGPYGTITSVFHFLCILVLVTPTTSRARQLLIRIGRRIVDLHLIGLIFGSSREYFSMWSYHNRPKHSDIARIDPARASFR